MIVVTARMFTLITCRQLIVRLIVCASPEATQLINGLTVLALTLTQSIKEIQQLVRAFSPQITFKFLINFVKLPKSSIYFHCDTINYPGTD